eukprot:CAMPEP_0182496088 /NCGR_PEP_ID=MMETSP1321-20130603/4770_1 /TAXON_ID=91990 /ORGANISM="Bolidomonas sp., Strain RCC1657" /LENGTH=570 /DNA_ID=CAMNT_0024699601 /DNA_START=108 /DNA_END=1820 /DNA_ORIENTATION=-
MRISKKFVGNNCIGKQVFRRKAVEMNKLTIDQLQRSRDELTELERKFLDRVSQTSRCKPGVMPKLNSLTDERAVVNPWVAPPVSYQPSQNSRAAAAGRSLLGEQARASSHYARNPNNPLDQNLTMSQLSQLRQTNGGPRTSSFEALMSLDFESMQSMENLNNANSGIKIKEYKKLSEHQNWSGEPGAQQQQQQAQQPQQQQQLAQNILAGVQQQQLAQNFVNNSNAQLNKLGPNSANNFPRPANPSMPWVTSSTGLSALRDQQGLNPLRNSSVEDFLSLVASGDIPAQDPHMLNIPLQSYIANAQRNPSQQNLAALHQLQQQIIAQQVKNIQVPMGSMNPLAAGGLNPMQLKQFQDNQQAAQFQQFQQMQQAQMQQQQMMMQAQMQQQQQQQQQFQALQQAHNAAAAQHVTALPNVGVPYSPGAAVPGSTPLSPSIVPAAGAPGAAPTFVPNQPSPNATVQSGISVTAPAPAIPAPLSTVPTPSAAGTAAPVSTVSTPIPVPPPQQQQAQVKTVVATAAAPPAAPPAAAPVAPEVVGGKRKAEEDVNPSEIKKEKVEGMEPPAVTQTAPQ